jgi:predicted restriction endonuclease
MSICPKPGCPAIAPCPTHGRNKNAPWSPNRNRASQARFRDQVLANAGNRCQAIDHGERCNVIGPRNLTAHHVIPLAQGGNDHPANGKALCDQHHRAIDNKAR